MLIGEVKTTFGGLSAHIRLLFALPFVRLLNVGEISVEIPRHVGLDRTGRVIADRES